MKSGLGFEFCMLYESYSILGLLKNQQIQRGRCSVELTSRLCSALNSKPRIAIFKIFFHLDSTVVL